MGLPGVTDSTVYEGLRDVLRRQPEVTSVEYRPDRIRKQFLHATVDPERIVPPTGPEPPSLEVEWRFENGDDYFRIHFWDPNSGFNCGWHRDEDHPELGPVHFQYESPARDETVHERATFSKSVPAAVLWETVEQLFEDRLPTLLDW